MWMVVTPSPSAEGRAISFKYTTIFNDANSLGKWVLYSLLHMPLFGLMRSPFTQCYTMYIFLLDIPTICTYAFPPSSPNSKGCVFSLRYAHYLDQCGSPRRESLLKCEMMLAVCGRQRKWGAETQQLSRVGAVGALAWRDKSPIAFHCCGGTGGTGGTGGGYHGRGLGGHDPLTSLP